MALCIAECRGRTTALMTSGAGRRVRTGGALVTHPDAFGTSRHSIRDARNRVVLRAIS